MNACIHAASVNSYNKDTMYGQLLYNVCSQELLLPGELESTFVTDSSPPSLKHGCIRQILLCFLCSTVDNSLHKALKRPWLSAVNVYELQALVSVLR